MKSKKNKLTNLLKTGILFFGISLLLWNCENQNESIIEASISLEDSNNYPNKISSIPLQELPFNLQETISKSKTLLKSKNETSVIFDSEIILKNIDSLKNINYSVRFYLKNQPENVLYNLIVSSEESNTPPYVLKFIIENFEEIKKDDEILDFSSMKGVFEKYSYNSFISNSKYKNKTSNYDPCNTYRFSAVNFIRIRYTPYIGGGGGGKASAPGFQWGAPTFTFPPVHELKTASKNDCDQIRIGGGGGGGNSVTINTGSGISRKICNNGRFINGECVPFSDLYQIINELTGKDLCVFNELTKLGLFKSTIGKFSNGNYDLTLKSWTKDACNNPSDDGCTDAKDLINGNITIYIQNPRQGTLDLATTILHEGIHAEIYKYVDEHKKGIDLNNRENLLEYYFGYKVDSGGNRFATSNAQHQHMADAYITPMAEALRQLDNYKYPVRDYLSLAWNGLRSYGIKDPSGVEGYFENGKWTTLDSDKSYEGMIKILKNTKFNKDCK